MVSQGLIGPTGPQGETPSSSTEGIFFASYNEWYWSNDY